MEEFQEADVLWTWPMPDTPTPSPEEGSYDLAAVAYELYEYDAAEVIDFSCDEPFSKPVAAWSASSTTSSTLSALLSSDNGGGFFLSGPSTVSATGLGLGLRLDAAEEFLEADVLWPDDTAANDGAAEFLWRRRRRIEEAAVFCGKREGRGGPLKASSPIDIPLATRGAVAARRRW